MWPLSEYLHCGIALQKWVFTLALLNAILATAGMAANAVVFFYYVTNCRVPSQNASDNLCYIFQLFSPKITDKSAPLFASVFMVYTAFYLYVANLMYKSAKHKSHENCRWAFIISVILWVVGTIIFVVILEYHIFVFTYIALFSMKMVEILFLKQFMDELHTQGYDR